MRRGLTRSQRTYSYDPEGAKKLLAEAGYPDGFTTTLNTDQNQYDTGYRELVAGYWSKIGVEVEIIGHGHCANQQLWCRSAVRKV